MRFLKIGTVGADPVAEVNDIDSAALIFIRVLCVSVVSVFHTKYGRIDLHQRPWIDKNFHAMQTEGG
ncbi:hypothetical protein KKI24_05270 [bacterium]|nr:hypothetical protein [bacterium]